MVDNFAIAISHLLIALAAWRLVWRADLDHEEPPAKDEFGTGFFQRKPTIAPKSTARAGEQETNGDA
jgi:hypothetical protein